MHFGIYNKMMLDWTDKETLWNSFISRGFNMITLVLFPLRYFPHYKRTHQITRGKNSRSFERNWRWQSSINHQAIWTILRSRVPRNCQCLVFVCFKYFFGWQQGAFQESYEWTIEKYFHSYKNKSNLAVQLDFVVISRVAREIDGLRKE